MTTGAELKAERLALGIRAFDLAGAMDRDPAVVTNTEQSGEVPEERARTYRRALRALARQREGARRDLLRELAAK